MSKERLLQIILSPVVTEKTALATESSNKYTFSVINTATKSEIKQAVELLFDVKVNNVSVLNVKGKTKRFRQSLGKRKDWKKAYVTLAEGNELTFEGVE